MMTDAHTTRRALAAAILLSASACSSAATVAGAGVCWRLLPVDRVRFQPRAGQGAAMVGGTIQGSNDGPTNGFTVLATVSTAPPDGVLTELTFTNATAYRYVKYYGPPGSYGQIAELELYSGSTRLTGEGFGTEGSRSGNPWTNALDGSGATFFDGALANDVYVGLDLAAGHVVATPVLTPPPGSYSGPQTVTISSATPGATILYTTNGSDPATAGAAYAGPFGVTGETTVRAIATKECMLGSAEVLGLFAIGTGSSSAASIHVGNSLTDSLEGYLQPIAASGGIVLDYSRYTVPGIGTYVYENRPTGGFGVPNVQTALNTKAFDHISFQPAANMPCVPTGHATEADASNRSDAVNIDGAWDDAVVPNANVQMWVYETWPAPTAYSNCLTGGGWLRDPAIWNPAAPTSWEDAESHLLQYNEAVRAGLIALDPGRPIPYVIPAGRALVALKGEIEAGRVPGMATTSFFPRMFIGGASTDDHLTGDGRYFVSLVFYACMFQRSPEGLAFANTTFTAEQATALQRIVWSTVSGYALSGAGR